MKYKTIPFFILFFFSIFSFSACATEEQSPSPVALTDTPDPCSTAALPAGVAKVNDLMREFDDYSSLASSTPQNQLVQVIPPLQEVRRRAEAQTVPGCLLDLKQLQIAHMNAVIETLMVFMASSQVEDVNAGIVQARELHMQYDIEIARLLGVTVAAPPTAIPGTVETLVTPTISTGLSVLNPGPNQVTLLSAPDAASGGVATLPAGGVTPALGRTADGLWFQVEAPGNPAQKAWVAASVVQVSGEPPVVVP